MKKSSELKKALGLALVLGAGLGWGLGWGLGLGLAIIAFATANHRLPIERKAEA